MPSLPRLSELGVLVAMRMVQASASSQPPPSAKPLIAAIEGFPKVSSLLSTVARSARSPAIDRSALREFVDIRAGDKGFFAGAGEDHDADGIILPRCV